MKETALKLVTNPLQVWRRISQFFFLLLLNPLFPRYIPGMTDVTLGICVPVMHCWSCPTAFLGCPVGAVGKFLAVGVFPFLSLGILFLTGAVLGRLVCGWVCPFGLVQDLMFKIPSKFKLRTPQALRWVKYGLLAIMVILIPLLFGTKSGTDQASGYFYCNWCPAGTFEASVPVNVMMAADMDFPAPPPQDEAGAEGTGEAKAEESAKKAEIPAPETEGPVDEDATNPWADLVLGYLASVKFWIAMAFLGGFIFLYRPFCKIACPIGAFLGLFNRISFLDFGKNRGNCSTCEQCLDVCPMIPEVVVRENPAECIRCYRCASPPCENEYEIDVRGDWCKDCNLCAELCPNEALTRKAGEPPRLTDPKACTGCAQCMVRCPELGITVREKTPTEPREVTDAS
ncbi:MAG: 4Fe-4S binding protein [Planctomycetota bacterium]|jgi:polyferredoxin